MKALITGASSGIGRDMALILGKKGYDLILVSRNVEAMEKIKQFVDTKVVIIEMDLAKSSNCQRLYDMVSSHDIDILINNAGFGVYGEFVKTDLGKELDIINVNIKAVHILTKLFLKDFTKKDKGYILNVASAAAFLPGPLMASYYASKAYVLRLTQAINYELAKQGSNVYLGLLCPGPVATNFNKVAGVNFKAKPLTSKYVAGYAIKKMFNGKKIIIPGLMIRFGIKLSRFVPTSVLLKVSYDIQGHKS